MTDVPAAAPALPGAAPHPVTRRDLWPLAVFVLVAGAGVYWAKWDPYWSKGFHVAATHSLGASIISGHAATAPGGWDAALSYARAYALDIWPALVVALVIAAAVQELLPRHLLTRAFAGRPRRSATSGTALAVPSMMCTCSAAPPTVALARSGTPLAGVLAYWLANPLLNPATLVFAGLVLGWRWAALRLVIGAALVVVVAVAGQRLFPGATRQPGASDLPGGPAGATGGAARPTAARPTRFRPATRPTRFRPATRPTRFRPAARPTRFRPAARLSARLAVAPEAPLALRLAVTSARLVVGLVPEYAVAVLALGAARAWLFPQVTPGSGHALWLVLVLAVTGTLFVVPTAGEIPVIATLGAFGLGAAGAAVLLITLPAVSLPSMAMLSRGVRLRVLAFVATAVALTGLLAAGVAAGLGL